MFSFNESNKCSYYTCARVEINMRNRLITNMTDLVMYHIFAVPMCISLYDLPASLCCSFSKNKDIFGLMYAATESV